MHHNGDMDREWTRRGLRSGANGLLLALLSQTVTIMLLVLSVLALALVSVGIGVLLLPLVTVGVRALTAWHRQLAAQWSDVRIPVPYRPKPPGGPLHLWRRFRWTVSDPATWRDLCWLLLEIPAGLVLGLLPASLIVFGLEGAIGLPLLLPVAVDYYGYGPFWPIENPVQGLVATGFGATVLVSAIAVGPWLIRQHALLARWLLAPTATAALAERVRQLAATRSERVDAHAAELRRIERDLHDGAQARLASLSMSIGLAEALVDRDPEAVRRLLGEAREASGEAMAELRRLVRGIHPPVLAERGLAGATRALALSLALPVDVDLDLPDRLQAPAEAAAYFAIAEALANVVKHSHAGRAWIRLRHADGTLTIVVGDDGIGGAPTRRAASGPGVAPDSDSGSGTAMGGGSGLPGIERRLAAFDGTMTLISPKGGPTVVSMELPCGLSSQRTSPSSEKD